MIRVFEQYVSPKSILQILLEAALIVLSVVTAAKLRFWREPVEFDLFTTWPDFGVQVLITAVVMLVCFYYNDLYDPQVAGNRGEQFLRLWQAIGAACILLGVLYFLVPTVEIGRGVFLITVVLVAVAVSGSRLAMDLIWPVTAPRQNVLILGAGSLASTVARELTKRNDLNFRLVGFLRPNGGVVKSLFGNPILGSIDDLQRVVTEHEVQRIVVALEDHRSVLPVRTLVNLRVRGIAIEDAPTALAALSGRVWLETLRPSWFVFSDGFQRSKATVVAKRALDLSLGMLGMIMSAPLMIAVAIAVRLDSKGPALYRQVRVGMGGKLFEVLKFRSMRVDAEAGGVAQWAQVDDPRVTRVGKFIRKYRLDELPQFFNVIRGEMSFIGPRPERPSFVDELREAIPYYDERHVVRPGLTGWAQVQFSYGSSVEDSARKLEYDLFYLKNMSIWFDFAILIQTVRIVLFGHGAR